MINKKITSRLLALPIMLMGFIQFIFSTLSHFVFNDTVTVEFLLPSLIMMTAGGVVYLSFRKEDLSKANFKDALIYACATWVIAGLLGAIPIMQITHISYTDAVFESISALTTTGATILSGLDNMPKTFLMYRQFLQWLGGLGIVIFVVAVLPMLNAGGMKLLKAETPGPIKDEKLSPRISNTAHYLWGVYITITLACAASYYLAGMSTYDAIAHSFTTVSTGGFSTHDASMWHYKSHTLLLICNIFMILGAINFALHFKVVYQRNVINYIQDNETIIFLILILLLSLILCIYLLFTQTYSSIFESMSFSTFHIISFMTSTGYGASGYTDWPIAAGALLVFTGYLGGCSGSTAGGNKIIRNIIAIKIINKNMNELIYPNGIFPIKYQGHAVSEDIRNAVMVFMTFSVVTSVVISLLLTTTGLDIWTAFTAVAACINVLGPGFGEVGGNFEPVSDTGTWILSVTMIIGRLEYFTVFALFSRYFWRH